MRKLSLRILCIAGSVTFAAALVLGAGFGPSAQESPELKVSESFQFTPPPQFDFNLYPVLWSAMDSDVENVVCRGLRRGKCRARARCQWIKKSGKRRAYCRKRGTPTTKCAGLRRGECRARARCRWVKRKTGRSYCRIR